MTLGILFLFLKVTRLFVASGSTKPSFHTNGSMDKFKSHLVAKGFSQVEGIDYLKIFSPVAKMDSSPTCSFTCCFSRLGSTLNGHQKITFLHGDLNEEIYMEQPPFFLR
jgi:hypothetical protein